MYKIQFFPSEVRRIDKAMTKIVNSLDVAKKISPEEIKVYYFWASWHVPNSNCSQDLIEKSLEKEGIEVLEYILCKSGHYSNGHNLWAYIVEEIERQNQERQVHPIFQNILAQFGMV